MIVSSKQHRMGLGLLHLLQIRCSRPSKAECASVVISHTTYSGSKNSSNNKNCKSLIINILKPPNRHKTKCDEKFVHCRNGWKMITTALRVQSIMRSIHRYRKLLYYSYLWTELTTIHGNGCRLLQCDCLSRVLRELELNRAVPEISAQLHQSPFIQLSLSLPALTMYTK